jgi:FkbM family methyltransferase
MAKTIETIEWHTLHPRYLSSDSFVLDIGANHGQFTRAITTRFGCRCVAVEPAPLPFASIPEGPLVTKMQFGVADRSGTMQLHLAEDSTTSSMGRRADTYVQTIDVPTLSLVDLLARLGNPRVDLLKVDIEGAEIGMLAAVPDDLLQRMMQISIEFHDFCGITPAAEVEQTLDRLAGLGFQCLVDARLHLA